MAETSTVAREAVGSPPHNNSRAVAPAGAAVLAGRGAPAAGEASVSGRQGIDMSGLSDREQLIRLTVVLEQLVGEVHDLSDKVESITEERMGDLRKEISDLQSEHAVTKDRCDRLSTVVYGTLAAVGIEFLALIGGLVAWLIQK